MPFGTMLARYRVLTERGSVARDADRIVRENVDAVAAARDLAWREDAGLLDRRSPGHWHRVQLELERRAARELGAARLAPRLDAFERFARLQ